MKVYVTKNKISLDKDYIVNKGEYKVNLLEFEFSEEYTDDLIKKAIFVNDENAIEQVILNNQCNIPHEVLNSRKFELRVYAYVLENDELKLRYSPTFINVFLREGSYRGNTGSGEVITPTQFEQYEQALNDGLQEIANVDIDANKSENVSTVTITNRYGQEKSVEIYDGIGIQYDWQGTSLGIKNDNETQYEYVDLKGDCNFATFEINDNMELVMRKTEDLLLDFELDENGMLYVII